MRFRDEPVTPVYRRWMCEQVGCDDELVSTGEGITRLSTRWKHRCGNGRGPPLRSGPMGTSLPLASRRWVTVHQQREALERRARGEALVDIARSYAVSHSTISRLNAGGLTINSNHG